jgi:hypothetical protein
MVKDRLLTFPVDIKLELETLKADIEAERFAVVLHTKSMPRIETLGSIVFLHVKFTERPIESCKYHFASVCVGKSRDTENLARHVRVNVVSNLIFSVIQRQQFQIRTLL